VCLEVSPFIETYIIVTRCLQLLGKSRSVGDFEVGRYHTDPDLGSSQNHEIAKSWLESCCALHGEGTQSAQASKLPTRVIDVGDLNGLQDPKIFLSGTSEGKYAALSHCWGGTISPLLTTENLESFQKSIPYCDLPANFRDAISITRQLGIQYLWIDSLCIIQNSRLDWEIESKKMGLIYRDALLAISASASPGSTYGILKSSPLSDENEKKVTLKVYKNSNLSDSVCISRRAKLPEILEYMSGLARFHKSRKKPENLYELFADCPLSKRGWTLQEGLLSPRILYYGERQIYWKCPHGFQSADGMPSVDGGWIMPPDSYTFPRITSFLHRHLSVHSDPSLPQTDTILEDYYRLVSRYSLRQLTLSQTSCPHSLG
jgi:Heterokaryon incompatibility protein (HET)